MAIGQVGQPAPALMLTSAVDGSSIDLADVFRRHACTLLLFDGATPTPAGYKRLVGLALDAAARWGDRVAAHIVTSGNDRPFEIPCAVGILFDDRNDVATTYGAATEQAYAIDAKGIITLHASPVDAAAVLAHLASAIQHEEG